MLANGRRVRIYPTTPPAYVDVQLVPRREARYNVYTMDDELLGFICAAEKGPRSGWAATILDGKATPTFHGARHEAIIHLVQQDEAARNKPKTVHVPDVNSDYTTPVELTETLDGFDVECMGDELGCIRQDEDGWIATDPELTTRCLVDRNDALGWLLDQLEERRVRDERSRRARWVRETVAEIEEQGQADGTSGELVAREILGWVERRTFNGYSPA